MYTTPNGMVPRSGIRRPRLHGLAVLCALAALALPHAAVLAAPPTPAAPRSAPSYLIYTTAHGLWAVRTDGGTPHLIAHGLARAVARLSTDGRYLLYAFPNSLIVAGRRAAVGWRELFLCRTDGSGSRVVAVLPASSFGSHFAWSADNAHFLYVRVRVTPRPIPGTGPPAWPWEVRAADLTTGDATTVWTGSLNDFSPVPLAWRRDLGRVFLVNNVKGGLSTRYEMIDTATHQIAEARLDAAATADVVPSPHQYYAAIAERPGQRGSTIVALYPIGALKSGVTSVTLARARVVGSLHWSLTGGNVAYTTVTTTVPAGRAQGVTFHVLSLLLGRDRVVGTDGLNSEVLGWSPNGQWLLIRHDTHRGRTLYLLAADGRGTRRRVAINTSLQAVAEGFVGWGQ
jgi:hypothetical protein